MRKLLFGLSLALIMFALYLVFVWVPTEQMMGIVQRIFYFHVPMAWVSFLAFATVFLGSLLYLWKKDSKWDILAGSAAEIGVIFATLVLITGPLWARPVWGVWWTWDARLTTMLVLWLIYLAYLMVRPFAGEESRGARYAAVVGIIGFIDVPIVALSISLWRTQHPGPLGFQGGGLAPSVLFTLIVSVAAFTIFFALLLMQRISLKNMEMELTKLKELNSQE